jgi:hypothetical protein
LTIFSRLFSKHSVEAVISPHPLHTKEKKGTRGKKQTKVPAWAGGTTFGGGEGLSRASKRKTKRNREKTGRHIDSLYSNVDGIVG